MLDERAAAGFPRRERDASARTDGKGRRAARSACPRIAGYRCRRGTVAAGRRRGLDLGAEHTAARELRLPGPDRSETSTSADGVSAAQAGAGGEVAGVYEPLRRRRHLGNAWPRISRSPSRATPDPLAARGAGVARLSMPPASKATPRRLRSTPACSRPEGLRSRSRRTPRRCGDRVGVTEIVARHHGLSFPPGSPRARERRPAATWCRCRCRSRRARSARVSAADPGEQARRDAGRPLEARPRRRPRAGDAGHHEPLRRDPQADQGPAAPSATS